MRWLWKIVRNWFCSWRRKVSRTEQSPMNETGHLWIDLSSVGGKAVLCDCVIDVSPESDVVEFTAVIRGLSADEINRLFDDGGLPWDEPTSGRLQDGRQFEGRIRSITSYEPTGPESMEIKGALTALAIKAVEAGVPSVWEFTLSNVQLSDADIWTDYPHERRRSLDSIEFTAAGRSWRLTDTWHHKWKNTSKRDLSKPVMSGVLHTAFQSEDSDADMMEIVQDITEVLSIAMSRAVNWHQFTVKSDDGRGIRGYQRSAWTAGFNKHGDSPVANYAPGSLKNLLELSLPVIAGNREWYSKTLGLLNQAQIADFLDVRCSILYTLADRVSSFVVGKTAQAEIDTELKSRARKKPFIDELHQILSKLSPENWTQDRTNNVLGMIKDWNKRPHFAVKIQRACSQLGLPEPPKALLIPRNDLLHDGELKSRDDDNYKQYIELDWVILTLVLRLFRYEGTYYHRKLGIEPVVLSDQLLPTSQVEKHTDAADAS